MKFFSFNLFKFFLTPCSDNLIFKDSYKVIYNNYLEKLNIYIDKLKKYYEEVGM